MKYSLFIPLATMTVNYSMQCSCHKDKKNLENGYSAMLVLKDKNTSGGELYIPEIKTIFDLESNDLVFFPSEELSHGNLPLYSKTLGKPHRVSIVLYTLQGLKGVSSRKELLNDIFQKRNA